MVYPLAAETNCITNPGNDFYLSLTPTFILPFSIDTDSPTLSPATTNSNSGAGLKLGLGYRIRAWRLQGEISYSNNKVKDIEIDDPDYPGGDMTGNYNMWAATINLFYDIRTCLKTTPYIGAGLGMLQFQANDITLEDDPPTVGCNNLFTYNLRTGIRHPFSPDWQLILGYQFTGMGEQDFRTGPADLKAEPIYINKIELGINYIF